MKNPKFFFNLWGRNLKGHFTFFDRLIKKNSMIGYPALALGVIPVTLLAPITSFVKAAIDFASRKALPDNLNQKLVQSLQAYSNDESTSLDITDVLNYARSYKKRTRFSTVSHSTRTLLDALNGCKPQDKQGKATHETGENLYSNLGKRVISAYMCDKNNVGKGMYRHIAEGIIVNSGASCDRNRFHANTNKTSSRVTSTEVALVAYAH